MAGAALALQFLLIALTAESRTNGRWQAAGQSGDEQVLRVLADGYASNRDALPAFCCKFEVIKGTSRDSAGALRGEFLGAQFRTNGIWVQRDGMVRYTLLCESPASEKVCASEAFLSDGNYTLSFPMRLKSGELDIAQARGPGIRVTPFSFGIMGQDEERSLPTLIQSAITGAGTCTVTERGDGCLNVDTVREEGIKASRRWTNRMHWVIDPSRGFLPVEVWVMRDDSQYESKTVVTEIGKLSNSVYYPLRSVTFSNSPDTEKMSCYLITVTELVKDVKDDDFSVQLSSDAVITIPSDMRSWIKVGSSRTAVSARDLEKMYAECERALQRRLAGLPPERPERHPASDRRMLFFVGNLCVFFVVLLAFWFFRRSRSRRCR